MFVHYMAPFWRLYILHLLIEYRYHFAKISTKKALPDIVLYEVEEVLYDDGVALGVALYFLFLYETLYITFFPQDTTKVL